MSENTVPTIQELTVRDLFAAIALVGILNNLERVDDDDDVGTLCYDIADNLLERR